MNCFRIDSARTTDRVKEFCLLQEELATAASSALRGFEASRWFRPSVLRSGPLSLVNRRRSICLLSKPSRNQESADWEMQKIGFDAICNRLGVAQECVRDISPPRRSVCFACKMQHVQEGQEPLQEGLLQVGKGSGVKET